jgi:hypothetical protein
MIGRRRHGCGLAVVSFALLCASGTAEAKSTFTTFNPPGAGYVQSVAINTRGTLAGTFEDESHVYEGFIRTSDGTITSIVPSGRGWLRGLPQKSLTDDANDRAFSGSVTKIGMQDILGIAFRRPAFMRKQP